MENTSVNLGRTNNKSTQDQTSEHENKMVNLMSKIVVVHIVVISALYYLGMNLVVS